MENTGGNNLYLKAYAPIWQMYSSRTKIFPKFPKKLHTFFYILKTKKQISQCRRQRLEHVSVASWAPCSGSRLIGEDIKWFMVSREMILIPLHVWANCQNVALFFLCYQLVTWQDDGVQQPKRHQESYVSFQGRSVSEVGCEAGCCSHTPLTPTLTTHRQGPGPGGEGHTDKRRDI